MASNPREASKCVRQEHSETVPSATCVPLDDPPPVPGRGLRTNCIRKIAAVARKE